MPKSKVKFTLNHAGVQEFLTHEPGVIALIDGGAEAVAATVRSSNVRPSDGKPLPVEVRSGVSSWPGKADRHAAMVTITHPAALPLEAKYGVLSKAVTAGGFQWGRKSKRHK